MNISPALHVYKLYMHIGHRYPFAAPLAETFLGARASFRALLVCACF